MSQAYRIRVSESLRRMVRSEDHVSTSLELLPILAPERMRDLLAAELERLGFVRDGACVRRADGNGVEVEVNLDEGTVAVRIAREHEVSVSGERTALSAKPADAAAQARARAELRAELEARVGRAADGTRAELTAVLERKLADLRAELDRAVVKATQQALRERAAEIGEVREVTEDAATGSLTIRVRL